MVSGIEGRGFHTEYRVCGDDGEHRDCSPSGNHKRNQIGTGGNFAAVSRIRGNSRRRPAMIAGSTARVLHHSSARIGRVSAARAFQPEPPSSNHRQPSPWNRRHRSPLAKTRRESQRDLTTSYWPPPKKTRCEHFRSVSVKSADVPRQHTLTSSDRPCCPRSDRPSLTRLFLQCR